MRPFSLKFFDDEHGQIFAGYMVALMLIFSIIASVMNLVRRDRVNTDRRVFQEDALEVAREGFEQGESYFRRQPNGVFINPGVEKPVDQYWVTPWPLYPDAAFLPQSSDTDHYNKISFSSNVCMTCAGPWAQKAGAGGLVRTFPLFSVATTGTAEMRSSPVWASYVLRRQNVRNWSPGPNTFAVFSDPDAAHDLTHLRSQSAPGAGNYWSLVSRAYVFSNFVGATGSANFETPAMYQGGNLLSAPVAYYQGKRFLLATARVYGELFRINCTALPAAVWVNKGTTVTVNTKGSIIGGLAGYAIANTDGVAFNGSGSVSSSLGLYEYPEQSPSVGNVFPGLTKSDLQKRADKVGGMNILPVWGDPNLADEASQTVFYYLTPSAGTFNFVSGTGAPVLTGGGLVFLDGNVVFQPGSNSNWSGIVYVNGNCVLHGPASVSGLLIVAGALSIGQVGGVGDNSTGLASYNANAIAEAQAYLQKFSVIKNSIVATTN